MDLLHSGNNDRSLIESLSFFAVYIRTNICYLRTVNEKDELSLCASLCRKLKQKILSNKDLFVSLSNSREFYGVINSISKLQNDISAHALPYFNELLLNSLLHKSLFCSELYRRYLECVNAVDHYLEKRSEHSNLHQLTWTKDDVLIGSLRNREQLSLCLKYNFYHVPVHQIPIDKMPVNYIAIYQSKNYFGIGGGINYYGKIISASIVDRSEITEIPGKSGGKYYKFVTDRWQKLPEAIKISSPGSYFSYTNLYKFLRASETHELYFESESMTKFYYSLKNAIDLKANNVSCKIGESEVIISDGCINIYNGNTEKYSVDIQSFVDNKNKIFKEITAHIM